MNTFRMVVGAGLGLLLMLLGLVAPGCGGESVPHAAPKQPGAERVRGTRVSLVRPKGFEVASSFAGFMDAETKSTLTVMEVEGPYAKVAQGFNEQQVLAVKRMTITDREPYHHGSYPGLLFQLTQETADANLRKWVWVFGSETRSVIIMGLCSVDMIPRDFAKLGDSVRSASWEPDMALDPATELDFYLTDVAGMKPLTVMSSALSYNSDGTVDEDGAAGKPLFIVVPAIRPTPSAPEKYAPRRMRLTAGHKKVKAGELTPITVDGLSGYECIGTSIHRKSDEPSFIYQVMLFEGTSYWNLTGIAREKDREQYLPAFKRMARSFQRKFEIRTSLDGKASIEVPSSWSMRAGLNEAADIQAGQAIAESYVIVLSEAKTDAPDGITLSQYAEDCRAQFSGDSMSQEALVPLEINGLKGSHIAYEMGDEQLPLTYVHATVEGADHFHQIILWCIKKDEAHALPGMNRVLHSFREVQ